MASLASLVSLGSASTSLSDGTLSLVRRVYLFKGSGKRWDYVSCKSSVTTDFIAEQGSANGNAVSVGPSYQSSKGSDSDFALKPSPKPVLKAANPVVPWPPTKLSISSDDDKSDNEEERKKVIDSLGEVLEKAEKLETSKPSGLGSKENVSSNKPATSTTYNNNTGQRTGRPVNVAVNKKAAPSKSVWRKGNPVANVQKFVKDIPKTVDDNTDVEENKIESKVKADNEPRVGGSIVQSPSRPQPMLQARPSVATPPPPPTVKRPVILRDVGGTPKSASVNVASATDSAGTKERKPILVDKFASKKPVVDPLIAQAVLAPPKPGKGPPAGKFKEDYRKKNASSGISKRRMVQEDADPDDETAELNVSIPRAGATRKKRKWTKASRKAARLQAARDAAPVKVDIIEVDEEGMLVEDLAYSLATSEGEILGYFYSKGIKPDGVQTLDKDMVKMICKDYDVEVVDAEPVRVEEKAKKKEIFDEEDMDKLEGRPPVITIMGHVDHGKTTLLDFIRKSKVTASEAGGITQGIGAYKLMVPFDGKLQPCVFLDTPGHEAFGAMRARGARVTDIAIIVVAADDGIRPQTNEAIAHAKAAGVPIVIAINKIDKEGANPERVMQELSSIGLMPEDWGGDVPMVPISALKGENVNDLLETIMLVAELQELKANPNRNAKGTVIEAGLHKSKGPVATFIVQNGTLKKGDVIVCGEAFGKVRGLFDDSGKPVAEAGPSIPVQVLGLSNVPQAGDEFEVVNSLDVARERAEIRAISIREERIAEKAGDGKVTLSSLASAVSSGKQSGLDLHQLNIILKVDVQGSIEAVRQALQVLPQESVALKFLLQATGDISASDVDLAVATKGIILGFNVKVPGSVKTQAENIGVEIRLYRVIYDLIDDVRKAMEGLLDSVEEQIPIGTAEVRAVFTSGSGRVAGCMVTDGKLVKGCGIRVVRKRKVVHSGTIDSLRRVKETVEEVATGLECGVGMDDYDDFEEGDILEAFNSVQKRRTLEEASATIAAALEGAGYRP